MFRITTLASCLFLLLSSGARAQTPTQPREPGSQQQARKPASYFDLGAGFAQRRLSFTALLKIEAVVVELQLTKEQKAKLKEAEASEAEALSSYSKKQRERVDQFQQTLQKSDASPREKVDAMNQLNQTTALGINMLFEEADAKIGKKVLDRRQAIRLRQIQIQAEGPGFFLRPEIQEVLALEAEQVDEIKRIVDANRSDMQRVAAVPDSILKPAPNAEPSTETHAYALALEVARNNATTVRASTMKAIEQVLIKPQRGKYKVMIGEPFRFHAANESKREAEKPLIKN